MVAPSGASETILMVENDELVHKSVKTYLESLGYRVLSACNGAEALEILVEQMAIDVLFTDVFMRGGMNGPELVASARQVRPKLKFLFTSGYLNPSAIRRGPGLEQSNKPHWPRDLAAKLRAILDSYRPVSDDGIYWV
jgi:CheY-like chemotaxis protein